jgi:hypothetical protein
MLGRGFLNITWIETEGDYLVDAECTGEKELSAIVRLHGHASSAVVVYEPAKFLGRSKLSG